MFQNRKMIAAIRKMDEALVLLDEAEKAAPGSTLSAAAALQGARDRAVIRYRSSASGRTSESGGDD